MSSCWHISLFSPDDVSSFFLYLLLYSFSFQVPSYFFLFFSSLPTYLLLFLIPLPFLNTKAYTSSSCTKILLFLLLHLLIHLLLLIFPYFLNLYLLHPPLGVFIFFLFLFIFSFNSLICHLSCLPPFPILLFHVPI